MLANVNDARVHAAFLRGLSGQSDFAEDRAAFAEIAEFLEHIVEGRLVVRAPRPVVPDDEAAASGAPVGVSPAAAAPATPVDETAVAQIDAATPKSEAAEASTITRALDEGVAAQLPSEPSA
jgi:hypothetical protein